MRIFGLDIRRLRKKALGAITGTWTKIWDWWPGAWQQDVVVDHQKVSAYWAVFSCVTLIAGDIAKLPIRVMERTASGAWQETPFRPVLRKPNRYQTRAEFILCLIYSLLLHGNAYLLKQRDERGFVVAMYVLDPCRVTPLVSDDGAVFYQLANDNLSGLQDQIVAPATEVIHVRINTLHHPLVGLSPIYACGVAAMQGLAIQKNSSKFFENMSRPGGILSAPGAIDGTKAAELAERWHQNFGGDKLGRVAVIGDGMKYEAVSMVNPVDAQLIEQLKMTAEMVAACFHVPSYKIGVGTTPGVQNTAVLNQQYYDQCLQTIIEVIELRLDEGLELESPREAWFDLSGLLRMDPEARYKAHSEAIKGGWKAPNEARIEEDLPPVPGGDTPYMQQQNYSLGALAERDKTSPLATAPAVPPPDDSAERLVAELIAKFAEIEHG